MKTKIILIAILGMGFLKASVAQQEWEPQTHFTGYINTIAEFTDVQTYKDADKDLGIGLSEAAISGSYKPLEKLDIKTTIVYRHFVEDIQDLVVEAYGTYEFSPAFKLGAGKFLTPLSPVNLYFYAPLNPSGVLPMVVSHHFLIPQSVSGFQFSGVFGDTFSGGYNVTFGNYANKAHPRGGIIGLQGNEDGAIYKNLVEDPDELVTEYLPGGSARLFASFNDMLRIGANYFLGLQSSHLMQNNDPTGGIQASYADARKYSLGMDGQFRYNNLEINGEYWYGEQWTTDLPREVRFDYEGYYVEGLYQIGKIAPFARYEYISDMKGSINQQMPDGSNVILFDAETNTSSYTLGFNYRPFYETLVKFEYRKVMTDLVYDNVMAGIPNPDNPLGIETDNYNYYLASLIYSF